MESLSQDHIPVGGEPTTAALLKGVADKRRLCFTIPQERFDSQEDSLKILRQRTRPATLYLLKSREERFHK